MTKLADTHISNPNLLIREDIKSGVFIENLTEETITSYEEATNLLKRGLRNRHIGATAANKNSSRSHSVFTFTIQGKVEPLIKKNQSGLHLTKTSKFHFVDLAGSERQKDSLTSGEKLKEACNINKSLTILGLVINSLVDASLGRNRHIPYRDSKLTFLLKDSLGGNSKTCMIANVSASSTSFHETLSTLKFAQRTKLIKNRICVNEEASGNLEALKTEIKRLKECLSSNKNMMTNVLEDSNENQWILYLKTKIESENFDFSFKIEDSLKKIEGEISQISQEIQSFWKFILSGNLNSNFSRISENQLQTLFSLLQNLNEKEVLMKELLKKFSAIHEEKVSFRNMLSLTGLGSPEFAEKALNSLKETSFSNLKAIETKLLESEKENIIMKGTQSLFQSNNMQSHFNVNLDSKNIETFLESMKEIETFKKEKEFYEEKIGSFKEKINSLNLQIEHLQEEKRCLFNDYTTVFQKNLDYENSLEIQSIQGLEEEINYFRELSQSLANQNIELNSKLRDFEISLQKSEICNREISEKLETVEQSLAFVEDDKKKYFDEFHFMEKKAKSLEETINHINIASNSSGFDKEAISTIQNNLLQTISTVEKLSAEKLDLISSLDNSKAIESELRQALSELECKFLILQNSQKSLQAKHKEKIAELLENRRLLRKAEKNESYFELVFKEEKELNKQTKRNLDKFKTSKCMLQRELASLKKRLAYEEKRRVEEVAKVFHFNSASK